MRTLRHYQNQAVDGIEAAWQQYDSTLLVMATGTGKTEVFAEIIRRASSKRAMVLAHRNELIWQAVRRIEGLGLDCSVEMADLQADTNYWNQTPVVVSTIQTQVAGNNGNGRMGFFKPEDFGIVIVDEAHHATSSTWRRTLAYYRQNPNLKILGVTATPDRADEEALGQVFQSVAFDYEILDAIKDGYLVPIDQQMVFIENLDFSAMRTTAGDLNSADLAAVMEAEKNLHGIVSSSVDIIKERSAVVFAVSVKQAEMMAEIFNRHRQGMAGWVCGKTPKEERRALLKGFDDGDTQVVVNVGVLTEGWDSPGCEVIIQARPTKSRCLYSQMVGRATRPLPGLVDGIATPELRREAIANSPKPSMLVVDFVGNAGKHKLMTTADILGGKVSDEAVERATKIAKEGKAVRMADALEQAERDIKAEIEAHKRREAARKAKIIGRASFSSKYIDPFAAFQLEPVRARGWDTGKSLSEKQRSMLLRHGVNPEEMPVAQARQVLNEMFRRFNNNLATIKQCKLLNKHGYETKNLTMKDASALIDALAKNNWKRPADHASVGFGTGINQFGA
jgi:superfamily II DNA or RNA helicase